jgi:NAD(P)H dehydrogenase (quinone)
MLPGFAFKFEKSPFPKQLLKGKTARIVATMDSPTLYYKLIVGDPMYKQIKGTLAFCGIKPIKKTYIGNLKLKSKPQRKKILQKIQNIGLKEF